MEAEAGDSYNFQTAIDPFELQQFVDKHVQIVATDGTKFSGIVFTIDPSSNSVVLVQKEDETLVDIIMGHAIKSICVLDSTAIVNKIPDNMFASASLATLDKLSEDEILVRKNKLISWLVLNKIPVEENGNTLKLHDSIEFIPPYGREDCRSIDSNELILRRVLDLLAAMPDG